MNIALILECLRRQAPLSRAELAQMTGLTKATVSSLVKELVAARFVRESGLEPGQKGRPAIKLVLNPEAGFIIGVEIGVESVSVLLTDFAAQPIWRHHEMLPRSDQATTLRRAADIIRLACQHAADAGRPVLGLGVGVPGLVDVGSGTLLYSANLGWTDVPLRALLESEFSLPVFVDNDANMAALGETYFGAARSSDFVLYVGAGVGLGGGIVLNRRIVTGVAGLAGEVGHMTIDPTGPLCGCGNRGCWEAFVSQRAVLDRVRAGAAVNQGTPAAGALGDLATLTLAGVVAAARAGNPVARHALTVTGEYLGLGLANLINALNPHRVVLGGPLSEAHEFVLPVIQAAVARRALRWSSETAEIVIATHGADACAMGCIAAVYHRVLSQPLSAARRPAGRPAEAGPPVARETAAPAP